MAYLDLRNIASDYVVGGTAEQMQAAAGDDWIEGSLLDGSIWARCMGGNDTVRLSSGLNNFVNGNNGNDDIHLLASPTGYSDGNVLGGADNDVITIHQGATWGVGAGKIINGNRGNDVLHNYGNCYQLRGGSENDTIINYGGSANVWGDRGADTFVPYALDLNGNWGSHMTIMDFNPNEGDRLDLSKLGAYDKLNYDSNGDGLIDTAYSNVNGPLACLVYSVAL